MCPQKSGNQPIEWLSSCWLACHTQQEGSDKHEQACETWESVKCIGISVMQRSGHLTIVYGRVSIDLLIERKANVVIPHTPCRHHVISQSVFKLEKRTVTLMSAKGLLRVKKDLLWQCGARCVTIVHTVILPWMHNCTTRWVKCDRVCLVIYINMHQWPCRFMVR